MKTRFNTFDIVCGVNELQEYVGMRVNQVYDIDNKTYLIRLQGKTKVVLLIESGIRFHTSGFEWPKNVAPSGFSMKLRKHLKNKRLEKVQQLGVDRIVDFQFGAAEAAYHVILELYDRGNIILTDNDFTILYVLRPHHEGEEVRFAVREKYPLSRVKELNDSPKEEDVLKSLLTQNNCDNLRRILMSVLDCGPTVIEHVLTKYNLESCLLKRNEDVSNVSDEDKAVNKKKTKQKKIDTDSTSRIFDIEKDFQTVMKAVKEAHEMLITAKRTASKGYIIQKREEKPSLKEGGKEHFYQNIEYHPYLFCQFKDQPFVVFDKFLLAVDEFYSKLEGQKIDLKTIQQEREALKKLSNVKKDHARRLEVLNKAQEVDKEKAELITSNKDLVDNAILAIRSAVANQMSWPDIEELVKAAQDNGDLIANTIQQLKLEINHISLKLSDPYPTCESVDNSNSNAVLSMSVDIDLALSACANARKYYDKKRSAAQKEQKTLDASQKALKSAEKKTQQALKDVRMISTITKARKVYWFEKFYWFISSENFLVIGGRDAQQNELIVKRYMRASDVYVHAEIQGASSVVVRNHTAADVPPKTLLEAGTMAISYSVAWDSKVITNAYWVHSDQVTKTAPTGEYLGTGSFMIRGKKNFLPSCHLIMGLSLLFKLEESFVDKHRGERRVRTFEEEDDHANDQFKRFLVKNEKLETINEDDGKCNLPEPENEQNEDERGLNDIDADSERAAESINFPDTEVKINHELGRFTFGTDSVDKALHHLRQMEIGQSALTEEVTLIPAAPSRKKKQQNSRKRKEERKIQKDRTQQEEPCEDSGIIKRGQKAKLKKIKSKYKDQDAEEREIRMKILKSAGKGKYEPLFSEADIEANDAKKNSREAISDQKIILQLDDEDMDDSPLDADVEILDSLTGQPNDDDELLFAIPVVAPYQSLQNYKFKVKLTPGTGKRGRAAKTAITIFSKDKSCDQREKDLLKSIKEETLARNIPGKVKISAPQLLKYKK